VLKEMAVGAENAELVRWASLSEAKCLRTLEDENAKLKRLPAEAMLDNSGLKDPLARMVMPAA